MGSRVGVGENEVKGAVKHKAHDGVKGGATSAVKAVVTGGAKGGVMGSRARSRV